MMPQARSGLRLHTESSVLKPAILKRTISALGTPISTILFAGLWTGGHMDIHGTRRIFWSPVCKLRNCLHPRLWIVCIALVLLPAAIRAATPTGYPDLITSNRVAGWAYDPDYPGSIGLQVYVDNVFLRNITANKKRADLTFWNNTRIAFDDPILMSCGTHLVTIIMLGM